MICIAVKGRLVVGIIYKLFFYKIYWVWLGYGLLENIKVFEEKELVLKISRVIVLRFYVGKVNVIVRLVFGFEFKVILVGGVGYKVLLLFEDIVDLYVYVIFIKKWDICVGDVFLRIFGGKMIILDNEAIEYGDGFKLVNEKGFLVLLYNYVEY